MQLSRVFAVVVALLFGFWSSDAFADDDAGAAPASSASPAPAAGAPPAASADAGTPPAATEGPPPSESAPPPSSGMVVKASTEVGGYVDSHATSVLTPSIGGSVESPTAGWGVNGRYLVDIVSAASPDIVSTASPHWVEIRNAGAIGGHYKPGTFGVAVNAATSYTPDYLALSAGATLTQELDDKNLTLIGSYGYGHDTIGRTGTAFSVFSRTLNYHSISVGASRVVNPGLVIGLYGDAVLERGDQSKPYRYIPLFSPTIAPLVGRGASADTIANNRLEERPLEQLPLSRDRFALTGRLAWRGDNGTTLRVEERGYADSWGLRASTTDVRYFIDTSRRVEIWPHLRFNIQNSVDFWQRAYASNGIHDIPALRTGDRELSSLFTMGGGGGLRLALGKGGAVDDIVWTTTLDGFYTSFGDTIYVTERFSVLLTTALEVTF